MYQEKWDYPIISLMDKTKSYDMGQEHIHPVVR